MAVLKKLQNAEPPAIVMGKIVAQFNPTSDKSLALRTHLPNLRLEFNRTRPL